MITRRLFGGGIVAALAGAPGPDAAAGGAAAGGAQSERDFSVVVRAIEGLRSELQRQQSFGEITTIREAQRAFLRQNGHFPEYIEVGADVWLNVHDWHVRWQQPVTLGRDAQGRLTILLLQTTVILRADVVGTFVSLPYDAAR